ncbi:MAG: hypothetical protein M3P06_04480 [Acidobacteriota bacterium]|nr:hypothetical protein [Acidobacteriota bacterium]
MRKTFVWALMATLALSGSAFARTTGGIAADATFLSGAPTTTNNDDSCDISVAPAATLLLPYFDVNLANGQEDDTLFTITNVSNLPQIAHVTVWTDRSFPVLDFNIFLTGYDVQGISMFDVLANGRLSGLTGTTSETEPGQRSADNDDNPLLNINDCDNLAVNIPAGALAPIVSALTTGIYAPGGCTGATNRVGNTHTNARGYVTVDVVRFCGTGFATDGAVYFNNEILFDNVLIGDYQQIDRANNFAQGNPMVHIRAIPEGGLTGDFATNFDRTFYSRYQAVGGVLDRRQPLPSTFAARWVDGGVGELETSYKIWREGLSGATVACAQYPQNAALGITEIVRFDEEENPETLSPDVVISPAPEFDISLPETSQTLVDDSTDVFPVAPGGALSGWMYLNLDHGAPLGAVDPDIASQNWVIVSMAAEGRFSVDYDAAWLGNGCSPAAPVTAENGADPVIEPADNITPDY